MKDLQECLLFLKKRVDDIELTSYIGDGDRYYEVRDRKNL